MKVKEVRKVYITLSREEREVLDKASTLIESIRVNVNSEDELAFVDGDDIIDSSNQYELGEIAGLLFNMTEFSLEII